MESKHIEILGKILPYPGSTTHKGGALYHQGEVLQALHLLEQSHQAELKAKDEIIADLIKQVNRLNFNHNTKPKEEKG